MGLIWTTVLNGGLGLGAYLVSRYGFRQPTGLPRTLAAVVLGWAWLTVGMELLGSIGYLARVPLLGWVTVGLLVGLVCLRWGRGAEESGSERGPSRSWTWEEVVAFGLVIWACVFLAGTSLLRPVKVVSDGPIYHLYFATRWWKEQRLEWIATPFGENAATYFPATGDLWFTWLLIGGGGSFLEKAGQAPFLAVCALTALALARRLGAGMASAAIATAWFLTSAPFLLFSFEPNVDTIFTAGYLLACYYFLRYALNDDGVASLSLGALAAGLALGTKAPSLVFIPPLLALGASSAIRQGKGFREKVLGVALVLLLPFTVAGYWYARNAILTGNPLYPLHLVAFGRVWLRGWYGPEVMRFSPYYLRVDDWRSLIDMSLAALDPRLTPFWLAGLAGAWMKFRSRSPLDRWVWIASALSVANVALFWLAIPYRTQQRFMIHALGLAVVPLARLFDRGLWLRWLGLGLLIAHLFTPQNWPFAQGDPPWDLSRTIPNAIPSLILLRSSHETIAFSLARLGIGMASFATAWAFAWGAERPSARRRVVAGASLIALVLIGFASAFPWGDDSRGRFFPPFREYYRGWLALDSRCGPSGSRIAYAGTNLPYYLMGVGFRNEVRYVNLDAHPRWLLHDYHLDACARASSAATWPLPRPGWDRIHPSYEDWISNLRREDIQMLVVTRANPVEGPHNLADADGFPIERHWAEDHPETFEPLYGATEGDPLFRIYRIKRSRNTTDRR
ncbi:MAG: hypothetical protein NVSMB9_05650 [Isosphaeraceae bacterium]